jgi:hypothetical protein
MTSVSTFVAEQNATGNGRGSGIVGLEYDDSGGGTVPAGDNAVIGLQNANFTTGVNAMVLDNPSYDYAVTIDGTGKVIVTDLLANQTVTATGLTYLLFDGSGTDGAFLATSGGNSYYSEIYIIGNTTQTDIAALYQAGLGRQPDLPGLEYWEASFAAGKVDMNGLAGLFITSQEFKADFSAAAAILQPNATFDTTIDKAFVDQLYLNVLGRVYDTGGEAYWISSLSTGVITPAQLLLDFAISSENLGNIVANNSLTGSPWLVDTSTGGIDNPQLPLATVAPIAVIIGDLNIDLVSDMTALAAGTTYATGIATNSAGVLTISANNFTVSGSSFNIDVTGSNDTITFNGTVNSQVTIAGGFVNGQSDTVDLSGTGNVIKLTINPSQTAPGVTINGWVAGQDQVVFYGPGSGGAPETGTYGGSATSLAIATPTTANPATWSQIATPSTGGNVGNSLPGVVMVGNVGGGSAQEMATAANLVYKVADAAGEQVIFVGQDNSGDAVLYYWGRGPSASTSLPATADTNGNHLVDAGEFTAHVVLVGVTASQLTAADIL